MSTFDFFITISLTVAGVIALAGLLTSIVQLGISALLAIIL